MIGFLQGNILENQEGKLLLGIGGVGYLVTVPQNATYQSFLPGLALELFIYTHVREDALDLYGFTSRFEKALFLLLLTVNGIGPKSALGILSAAGPNQLVAAIVRGDQRLLTSMPGVGKKTAERVVVELRDVIQKKLDNRSLVPTESPLGSAEEFFHSAERKSRKVQTVEGMTGATSEAFGKAMDPTVYRDAKDALVGLGYKDYEIDSLMGNILESLETPPQRAEDLIKTVLKSISGAL